MSELSERLREAHPNSQQYALGSNILHEAAQEIEALQAECGALVEALEEALHHVIISPDPVRSDFIKEIEAALAAHRKQEEAQP